MNGVTRNPFYHGSSYASGADDSGSVSILRLDAPRSGHVHTLSRRQAQNIEVTFTCEIRSDRSVGQRMAYPRCPPMLYSPSPTGVMITPNLLYVLSTRCDRRTATSSIAGKQIASRSVDRIFFSLNRKR